MLSGLRSAGVVLGCALLAGACGGGKSAAGAGEAAAGGGKVLNLYIWSDYLAPNTLSDLSLIHI